MCVCQIKSIAYVGCPFRDSALLCTLIVVRYLWSRDRHGAGECGTKYDERERERDVQESFIRLDEPTDRFLAAVHLRL